MGMFQNTWLMVYIVDWVKALFLLLDYCCRFHCYRLSFWLVVGLLFSKQNKWKWMHITCLFGKLSGCFVASFGGSSFGFGSLSVKSSFRVDQLLCGCGFQFSFQSSIGSSTFSNICKTSKRVEISININNKNVIIKFITNLLLLFQPFYDRIAPTILLGNKN